MTQMKRVLVTIVTSVGLLLAIPATALATLTELGLTPSQQVQQPSPMWPTPTCSSTSCYAVVRTTGFQATVAGYRGPSRKDLFTVPRNGSIVAWTVSLGSPTKAQISYFDGATVGGGPAQAGIAVLRPGPHLSFRLLAQSPLVALQPYFGKTAQFPLAASIPVVKGNLIALTVPTWAPVLALGFAHDTAWRASRSKKQCSATTSPSSHTTPQSVVKYVCLYSQARLTYSVTLISTP
jgi:hypothetical protein